MRSYRLIDLFAGCGGMTLGFTATGRYHAALGVESDPDAAQTYERNFGLHLHRQPDGSPSRIEAVHRFPAADVVIGGPPCQGFSALNMHGIGLHRRELWVEYVRALEQSKPALFVMENVPALLSSTDYAAFRQAAEKLGYAVEGRVLNAADYGVAQTRRRAIVIGSVFGEPTWPAPTHHAPGRVPQGKPAWRTFRHAVEGLSDEPDGARWHNARNPRPLSMERYTTIPAEGEGRFELAERRPDITPPCWRRKKTGSTDVFGRLWWDRPVGTIRTEFYKPEKGRYLHPSEHRPITVREAARCMSFPDDFELPLEQSMTSIARQIGNAVPVALARQIALEAAAVLDAGAGSQSLAA